MTCALEFYASGELQVYSVGLQAGGNDVSLLEKTDVGRDISRQLNFLTMKSSVKSNCP